MSDPDGCRVETYVKGRKVNVFPESGPEVDPAPVMEPGLIFEEVNVRSSRRIRKER